MGSLRSWSVEDKFEDGGERKDWNLLALAHSHSHLPPGQSLFPLPGHSTNSDHAESGTRLSAIALPQMQLALVDTPWMLVVKSATFSGKGNPAGLTLILDVRVREILV